MLMNILCIIRQLTFNLKLLRVFVLSKTVVIKHLEMSPGFEIKKLSAADSYKKVAHFNGIMTIVYEQLQSRK